MTDGKWVWLSAFFILLPLALGQNMEATQDQPPIKAVEGQVVLGVPSGQTRGGSATRPQFDPQAAKLLRQTLNQYQSCATYQDQARLSFVTLDQQGVEKARTFDASLAFERPNKIQLVWFTFRLTCDGQRCLIYYPSQRQFTDQKAPAVISMPFLKDAAMNEFLPIVLGALVQPKPYEALVTTIDGLGSKGMTQQDGKKYHQLYYFEGPARWDLLIDAQTLLFKRITVSPRKEKGSRWEIRIAYRNVEVNQPIPAAVFAVSPPSGARRVERISLTRQFDYARLGQIFPDTVLAQWGGDQKTGVLKLLGARITFVDFWATWCPPCRAELPELEKLYQRYKNQGFQLIGINLDSEEAQDEIKSVIREIGVSFPTLLDPESKLAETMQVKGIPMLLILDGKGKILQVHVGASPNTPGELRAAIEDAIRGTPAARAAE
jgi:thiol-disulfide isomerase/thioredoxin